MHHLMRNLPVVGRAGEGARPELRSFLRVSDERIRRRAHGVIWEIEGGTPGRDEARVPGSGGSSYLNLLEGALSFDTSFPEDDHGESGDLVAAQQERQSLELQRAERGI